MPSVSWIVDGLHIFGGIDTVSSRVGDRAKRPWGSLELLCAGRDHVVARLHVRAMQRTSLQRHRHRAESWVVVSGRGYFWYGSRRHGVTVGDVMHIPRGQIHRIEAHQDTDLVLVEVQTGDCREEDVQRLEDDYHR